MTAVRPTSDPETVQSQLVPGWYRLAARSNPGPSAPDIVAFTLPSRWAWAISRSHDGRVASNWPVASSVMAVTYTTSSMMSQRPTA